MVVTATRGALGFLTRIPVGHDAAAWEAFRRTPVSLVLVGYLLGGLLLLPLLLPLPAPTLAIGFVVWIYLLTGIAHLDGLADLGDGLVIHGEAEDRRAVMHDAQLGVGGTVLVVVAVLGLGLAAVSLAAVPVALLGIVIAAEVGAKLGMVGMICLGSASHDGLGAQLVDESTPAGLIVPVLVALPAVGVTGVHIAGVTTLIGGLSGAAAVGWWAHRRIDGISGDVLGAGNEVARLVGLHLGVVAWMLW